MKQDISIAIVGAGIGGLTAAASLVRFGFSVRVYEQADQFAPIGAGIQLTANAMKGLKGLGLSESLRSQGFVPSNFYSREWDTGNISNVLPMGKVLEQRYGAPDLMIHRARLHSALAALTPHQCIHFGKKVLGIESKGSDTVALAFADGSRADATLVIGADGIHSIVREALFGAQQPHFTGRVAYRTTYSTAEISGIEIDERAKWWGPDRHVVHYFTTPAKDEIYFIAVAPEPDFQVESWSMKGDRDTLMTAFAGFHTNVRTILSAAPDLRKWALVERDPLPSWWKNSVVLLGDACHPMTPYMAQGAASAIEDAVILARCLEGVGCDDISKALSVYTATRRPRTDRMQLTNRDNTWLRKPTDTDWVYEYDAWHAQLLFESRLDGSPSRADS